AAAAAGLAAASAGAAEAITGAATAPAITAAPTPSSTLLRALLNAVKSLTAETSLILEIAAESLTLTIAAECLILERFLEAASTELRAAVRAVRWRLVTGWPFGRLQGHAA